MGASPRPGPGAAGEACGPPPPAAPGAPAGAVLAPRLARHLAACLAALRWAEERAYRGYSKHDGLNSPLLHALARGKWPRLLAIQLVSRAPLNLRPFLGVRKAVNPKGLALFARAYLTLHGLGVSCEEGPPWLERAEECLGRLAESSARTLGYSGDSWGYPYDWQDAGFFAPAGMPNCVVTCFAARAFLHAHQVTGRPEHLSTARSACRFLLRDLPRLHQSEAMLCLGYAPVPMKWVVMDTSALAGALLALTARASGGDRELVRESRRLIAYVADKQTAAGAWYYSHPPEDSSITHDNYHTGFILDALLDYCEATGEEDLLPRYERGLGFYAERLFLPRGAPKWRHDRIHPHDIHGSAQGTITFSRAARFGKEHLERAERIAGWALEHLYLEEEGRFFYQKGRFWTKRFTLMRWCQAWMSWALASLLQASAGRG